MNREKFLQNSFRAWNILPAAFLELCNRNAAEVPCECIGTDAAAWRGAFAPFVKQRKNTCIDGNKIARIEIRGPLFREEAPFTIAAYGGTDYGELLDDLEYAENNACGIFLEIDSPG